MMQFRTPRRTAAVLVLLAAPFLTLPAGADDDDIGHEEARQLLESGRILPLEAILESLRETVPGGLLKAELEYEDGAILYDLKILRPGGRVQEVEIDATTGRILKIEDDD